MERWIIVGALIIAVVILISIYRMSLRKNRLLTDYVMLMVLDKETYAIQRSSLAEYVEATQAENGTDLATKVSRRIASELPNNADRVARLLWDFKTRKSL